jgi:hypothetical protein
MLPSQSTQNAWIAGRQFLRLTIIGCLSGCMLTPSLQAQDSHREQERIRQPSLRLAAETSKSLSAEPTLPRNNSIATSETSNQSIPVPAETRASAEAIKPIAFRSGAIGSGIEGGGEYPNVNASSPIASLENPPGWNAVEKSIREKLELCDTMLRRGAIFSARQTCWKGLEELCQVLDLHDPRGKRIESLRRALVAMREEEDFYRYSDIQLARGETLANLCFAHQTPIVRSLLEQDRSSTNGFNPLIAAQHYRSYARDQLVQACDYHPWGADLLYALGKAFEKQAWEDRSRSALVHQHAELVYQAALETNPKQSLAATQLGYVLLQLDRPQEAQLVLVRSLQVAPSQASLQNLAEAYRRLHDATAVQWCVTQIALLQQNEQAKQIEIPFTEIDPRQFAAISPRDAAYVQGNGTSLSAGSSQSNAAYSNSAQRIATQPAPQSNPDSNGAKGWLPSLWR